MRAWFSPRLLALALDRHYRGDEVLAVEREGRRIGAIWKAAPRRRSVVTGGLAFPELEPVFYHPLAAPGEDVKPLVLGVIGEKSVIALPGPLRGAEFEEVHSFRGDLWFHESRALANVAL
jgi:hypothetical protein